MTDIIDKQCPICYDNMGDEKNLICGHLVHVSCIKKSFRAECPLCRTKLDIEVEGKYVYERRYENEDTEEHAEDEDEEEYESEDEEDEEKRPYWSYIEDDDSERESDTEKEGGFYSEDDEEEQDSDEDDKMPLPECTDCEFGYPHRICLRRVLLQNISDNEREHERRRVFL